MTLIKDFSDDTSKRNVLEMKKHICEVLCYICSCSSTCWDSYDKTISEDWKSNARRRIKGCDVVVVICGKCTDSATGVSAELRIAQDENIPYFLLGGRSGEVCVKPTAAKESDKVYKWTWDNLKRLIGGAR